MAGFDELKKKALDAAEAIADKSFEIYKAAEEATRGFAKTTKLNAEIAKEKSNVKKMYAELGSLYYSLYSESPDERLSQLCLEITAALESIELKQAELDDLKENPDIEVEFVQTDIYEDDVPCESDAADVPADEETADVQSDVAEEETPADSEQ